MATSICSDLGKSQRNQSNRRKGCKSEVSRVQLDRLELLLRHAQILSYESYGNIFSIDCHNCISHIHLMRQFVAKLRRWKKSPGKSGVWSGSFLQNFGAQTVMELYGLSAGWFMFVPNVKAFGAQVITIGLRRSMNTSLGFTLADSPYWFTMVLNIP